MSNLSTFKRLCTTAGDVFTVMLIAVLILFPAFMCSVGILIVLMWLGLQEQGKVSLWIMGIVFVATYLPMLAVWLFKSYGARIGFIDFCNKHPRFGAATMLAVNGGGGIWRVVRMVGKLIENVIAWLATSVMALLVCIIIGVILYALVGALSAPWWALVIIYLLLKEK
ncbi:hypothetical protein SAMN04515618_104168 [Collimonas sp. OK307]|uniref:hypothetical protein n=1 Tax=Collimonas sp. OK307 TaxID=1801620 RepID=UPI0008E7625C|nr:hypothetical protein [Collimonas sp. OK307]SFH85481.1 hypothetical protein SAMN04515618_104168 [Collimonas sp. OK307]